MSSLPALLGNKPACESKINFVRPVLPVFDEVSEQVGKIFETGMLTKGAHLLAFEEALAAHLRVKHAVAVSSCTAGLMLTYRALGLKGEVVVPSFTFMATVSALVWAGVRPVFADADPATANLDPSAAEAAITPETSALVAVHNFGNPCDVEALQRIAQRHNLRLIFDAAHGFGSLYQGAPLGPQGDASVFSLTPTKLVIAGEGGVVATDDAELARRVRMGREYGNKGNYDSEFSGINARLPEFNALLGLQSLRALDAAVRQRNQIAAIYLEKLGQLRGIDFQKIGPGNRSSYCYFNITIAPEAFGLTRDELALALAAENIDTRKYYAPPVHRQSAYTRYVNSAQALPDTDLLSETSLALPLWSDMQPHLALNICAAIERISRFAPEIKSKLDKRGS
jgi:dTDP-4-amino-4,6-dideoxygalactose transaminase